MSLRKTFVGDRFLRGRQRRERDRISTAPESANVASDAKSVIERATRARRPRPVPPRAADPLRAAFRGILTNRDRALIR